MNLSLGNRLSHQQKTAKQVESIMCSVHGPLASIRDVTEESLLAPLLVGEITDPPYLLSTLSAPAAKRKQNSIGEKIIIRQTRQTFTG